MFPIGKVITEKINISFKIFPLVRKMKYVYETQSHNKPLSLTQDVICALITLTVALYLLLKPSQCLLRYLTRPEM